MPKVEFLADMNISPQTIQQLRNLGWTIDRVSEIMKPNSKDSEILSYARGNEKIIVTHDLDFSSLLALGGHKKPSVINLRLDNVSSDIVTQRIVDVVTGMETELVQGVVISVDETSARFRYLPIFT